MASVGTVISYPIPAFSNLPIHADFYQPSVFEISAVTLGFTTTVTTSEDHNYVIGQEIRLIIPPTFGCRQLNGVLGIVLSIPADDQVELDIYSLGGNAFVASSSTVQSAQIIATGDYNMGIISSTGRIIPTTNVPGAFINISP